MGISLTATGAVGEEGKDFRVKKKKEVPCIVGMDNINAMLESLDARPVLVGMSMPSSTGVQLPFQQYIFPLGEQVGKPGKKSGFLVVEKLGDTFCVTFQGIVYKVLNPKWEEAPKKTKKEGNGG